MAGEDKVNKLLPPGEEESEEVVEGALAEDKDKLEESGGDLLGKNEREKKKSKKNVR
jgi:hypothetical protein